MCGALVCDLGADLHIVWHGLENAYGSVPHQLIKHATEFFHMPDIRSLVSNYFKDLQMSFALQDFTTGWWQLEVEIAMGCSISPILFVLPLRLYSLEQDSWWDESDCHRDRNCPPEKLHG